jgi:sarcosine oxidase, subunit gamma
MADLTTARSMPALVPSGAVRPLPPASRFVLRGAPAVMAAAAKALDLNISDTACRSATRGQPNSEWAALWLGPDEQLLLAPVPDGEDITARLRDSLSALPHSLVDVSHRQVAIEISGPTAQTLLNSGCPLDLHISAFPTGMCTRTVLGKVDIVLWRRGASTFHVEVWRSFAGYATRFLAESARELA